MTRKREHADPAAWMFCLAYVIESSFVKDRHFLQNMTFYQYFRTASASSPYLRIPFDWREVPVGEQVAPNECALIVQKYDEDVDHI